MIASISSPRSESAIAASDFLSSGRNSADRFGAVHEANGLSTRMPLARRFVIPAKRSASRDCMLLAA